MSGCDVVVGAGMTGLLTAALLKRRQPDRHVMVVEKAARTGGIYASFDYGSAGSFDHGMHILYDTGIEELDAVIRGVLPEAQWHKLEGNRKDIAGIFWNGVLQQHSPYLDLRSLSAQEREQCLADLREAAKRPSTNFKSAHDYFNAHFGNRTAVHLHPVIEKLYDAPSTAVSWLAARQPAMNRVLLLDAAAMPPVLADEALRARIGYPDQLAMPALRPFEQIGWYPRRMGMGRVVAALESQLRAMGVEFRLEASVLGMTCNAGRVQNLTLCDQAGERTIEALHQLYWSAGWHPLARLLGLDAAFSSAAFPAAWYVHLRVKTPPDMGELYHFYVFEPGLRTFRVTNYVNYCPQAVTADGYPLCVEYWPDKDAARAGDPIALAMSELRRMGVVRHGEEPNFSAVQIVPNYHRQFLAHHVQAIEDVRTAVAERGLANLSVLGMLASGGELLLYEVMRDAYQKLKS